MLKGLNVLLRPMTAADIDAYAAMRNDLEIILLREDKPPQPRPVETFRKQFEEYVKAPRENTWFAIEADGKFIGDCSLRDFTEHDRTCQLGIGIADREYWGHGYGREAVQLLLDYAFRIRNMRRVWLSTSSGNVRAQRCYLACGFKEEGRMREHIWVAGKYEDFVFMGILKTEWEARI